jgi:hypothetical protein
MVRPAASVVSALSGFVANGRQASITFPLPPLKFRTVGFPQYGFKPALLPRPSRPPIRTDRLYAVVAGLGPQPLATLCVMAGAGPCRRSGPEALGSASGYSVPSRHRLLWPHPSLWPAPVGFPCRYPGGSLPAGVRPEGPQFTLRVLLSVPPSLPRRARRWADCSRFRLHWPSSGMQRLGVPLRSTPSVLAWA